MRNGFDYILSVDITCIAKEGEVIGKRSTSS